MSTYTQILYQIVFCPKHRAPCLKKEGREELFKHIAGLIKNKNCHLYRINGVEDHIHILTHLHPTVALSTLVQCIKVSSSNFIKETQLFPDFQGWQNGYCAITYSNSALNNLIEYVKNQEAHHKKLTSKDELLLALEENNIQYDERYLE
ncbi:MAG: IS200/IS605 family transposase [Saprospiraceae bacterium]